MKSRCLSLLDLEVGNIRIDVIFSQPDEISSLMFRHTVDVIHSTQWLILFTCLDCQEALFNPNCMTKVLLEDIKKRCRRDREGV